MHPPHNPKKKKESQACAVVMLIGRLFYLWTHKELVYKGRTSKLPQDSWQKFDLSAIDLLNLPMVGALGNAHICLGAGVSGFTHLFPCTYVHTRIAAQRGTTADTKWNGDESRLTRAAVERSRMQPRIFCLLLQRCHLELKWSSLLFLHHCFTIGGTLTQLVASALSLYSSALHSLPDIHIRERVDCIGIAVSLY